MGKRLATPTATTPIKLRHDLPLPLANYRTVTQMKMEHAEKQQPPADRLQDTLERFLSVKCCLRVSKSNITKMIVNKIGICDSISARPSHESWLRTELGERNLN